MAIATHEGHRPVGMEAAPQSHAPQHGVATSSWDLTELLEVAQQVATDLAARLRRPDLVDQLAPVATSDSSDVVSSESSIRPTLHSVQSAVSRLSRTVEGAQTAMAGVADRVFQDPDSRERLLGLPRGKTGFRDTADFLGQTQQVPHRDAKNRVERAAHHLPPAPVPGSTEAPPSSLQDVSSALWDNSVDPAVVDMITRTLTQARQSAAKEGVPSNIVSPLIEAGQKRLMGAARGAQPSTVSAVCKRWRRHFDEAIRAHSATPTLAQINQGRSLKFLREDKGLYFWQMGLTQDQHEILKTVASAGSNPRAKRNTSEDPTVSDEGPDVENCPADSRPTVGSTAPGTLFDLTDQAAGDSRGDDQCEENLVPPVQMRQEERQRREIDAVISALTAALRLLDTDVLSNTGGARPQVLVTIDFETLQNQVASHPDLPPQPPIPDHLADQNPPDNLRGPFVSHAAFSGPIDPRIIRAWACEADIIPVVLGGDGRILDYGRRERHFTAHQRRAIIARDRGCVAPGCSIPPGWCEAHHVTFWSNGGSTAIDNGALLCSHHHMALHHDQLDIEMRNGVPYVQDRSVSYPVSEEPRFQRNLQWHD